MRFELEQVKQAAERAARFTRQLLAFSRQQVLSPRLIDPADTIDAMAADAPPVDGRRRSADVTERARASGKVKVDPGQFEQVVMNLAVNARDAMPNGGTLRLDLIAQVEVSRRPMRRACSCTPGPYVAMSATDNGLGMDDATRARIFEPFFTTKPTGQGTGLGLSTVYGILQQSGGAIEVRVGAGAAARRSRVYLPVAAGPVEPQCGVSLVPHDASASSRARCFVAEDEEVRSRARAHGAHRRRLPRARSRVRDRSGGDAVERSIGRWIC